MNNFNGAPIALDGHPVHTVGRLPEVGTQVLPFQLTGGDLQEKTFDDYKGKFIIMNIFPSVNTGVCSASVVRFNQEAAHLPNVTVLCISKDLPFAQQQFCGARELKNVVMLSDFRNDFGNTYGVQMADGVMRGLHSRALLVIDPKGTIVFQEQVPDIDQEPDYAGALAAIRQ